MQVFVNIFSLKGTIYMAKVVFFQNQWTEYLGVMYISAMLKRHGHQCDVFIDPKPDKLNEILKETQPDICAFPTITGLHLWALDIAAHIKEKSGDSKPLTILGGPHPTHFPDVISKDAIDIICRGEGEYPMLDLANALDNKNDITNIPNLWVNQNGTVYKNDLRPLIENLDELPFPDRDLYSHYSIFRSETTKMFLTTRGCPFSCAYCYNRKLKEIYMGKGKYLRRRSIANVIEEIKQVRSTHRLKNVYFIDDTFAFDKEWCKDFLKVYRNEIDLSFFCLGTADGLNDESLVREFKESKCFGVYFGIESGNEELRTRLLNKKITNEQIIRAAQLLKKYGLKFRTYNMVGLPGETLENVYETIELNIKIKTNFPFCSIFMPYWGTELFDYAIEKGLLSKDSSPDDFYTSYYGYSMLKQKDIDEMVNLQKFFQTAVLFPGLFPLIKRLAKLPTNIFFNLWFGLIFYWIFLTGERRPFFWTIWFGLRNSKLLTERKNKTLAKESCSLESV